MSLLFDNLQYLKNHCILFYVNHLGNCSAFDNDAEVQMLKVHKNFGETVALVDL